MEKITKIEVIHFSSDYLASNVILGSETSIFYASQEKTLY